MLELPELLATLVGLAVAACGGDDSATGDGDSSGSTSADSGPGTSLESSGQSTIATLTAADTSGSSDTGVGECTDASECPAPGPCEGPASCAEGSCMYGPLVCSDPPPSPDLAECMPGGMFTAYLGGACGGSCEPTTGKCEYAPMLFACPPANAVLPQQEAYQVVLRNYMEALVAADFDVEVGTITYDPNAPLDDEQLYRLWTAVIRAGGTIPNLPSYAGLRLPSTSFVLATIEGSTPIRAMAGRESPLDVATAWYTTWDYAGNPFYQHSAAMQRAFVIAAADMITLDACTAAGNCGSGDWLAGALRTYAAIGLAAHTSDLDACAVAAYDVGLRRAFDRLEAMNYSSPNADIYVAAPAALAYVAAALQDPALVTRASIDAAEIMSTNCNEAGFCQHQNGGYDASYEGWSMLHLVEGALVSGDPGLVEWVERFARLKAYTTVLEPDGVRYVGPSHFSPATCAPAAIDQGDYHLYTRETAVASLVDAGRYLAFGGRDGWPTLPTPEQMREDIEQRIVEANSFAEGDPGEIPPWQERHYPGSEDPGFRRYRVGTYATLRALGEADDPLTRIPALGPDAYVETFGDQFAVAKQGALVAMIHTGIVDSSNEGSGFGAGALSTVWSEDTGAVILGWNRGSQNTGPAPFTWSEARYWPTHALTGRAGGSPFSSARILDAVSIVDTSVPDVLVVDVSGDLGQGAADPDDVISSAIYARHFEVSAAGVRVETSLTSANPVMLDELFEVLPIAISLQNDPATTIDFELSGGGSLPAGPGTTDGVAAVVVTRFGSAMRIDFDAAQRVALADQERTSDYQWSPVGRNLWIVLADSPQQVTAASVGYLITVE